MLSEEGRPLRESIELASQQSCTRIKCCYGDHKHQHTVSSYPAIAVLQKNQLHSSIAVRPQFSVVWRIQVQKRAAVSLHFALKDAAVDGRDSPLDATRGAIGVDFNCSEVSARTIGNLQQCGAVTRTRIYGSVRT